MGPPPRVVFLTDIATPYMVAVLAALARRVDLLVVFCAREGSRGAAWAFRTPFPFRHRVLGGTAFRRPSGDAADLYPNPRAFMALLAERPAAVISGAFSFPTLAAALYGRLFGAPFVIHSDGTSFSERNLSRAHLLARDLLLHEAAACVANSEPAAARFSELGTAPERLFLAPHSTDVDRFHAVARQRFEGTDRGGPARVLHVGRFIPRKGIDRLLRAVSLAAREVPLRLTLVGAGPEEPRLRRIASDLGISDAVEFRGFVDQPDLPGVYADADIFAFPTLEDPFGIVVLEAAAAGLPIVASPHGGATLDLVKDGQNGFVVAPEDVVGWSRALIRLARDAGLRRRLGAFALKATLDRTPEHAADGYAGAVMAALRAQDGDGRGWRRDRWSLRQRP